MNRKCHLTKVSVDTITVSPVKRHQNEEKDGKRCYGLNESGSDRRQTLRARLPRRRRTSPIRSHQGELLAQAQFGRLAVHDRRRANEQSHKLLQISGSERSNRKRAGLLAEAWHLIKKSAANSRRRLAATPPRWRVPSSPADIRCTKADARPSACRMYKRSLAFVLEFHNTSAAPIKNSTTVRATRSIDGNLFYPRLALYDERRLPDGRTYCSFRPHVLSGMMPL